MPDNILNTEEKILEAAAQEFIMKGKAGARMQEIADNAGINKALLHYYYRSKDLLFEAVFSTAIRRLLLPRILQVIESETDVFELIRKFTAIYLDVLNNNPNIPFFIIEEINKNPHRMANIFLKSGLPVQKVISLIEEAIEQGKIRPIEPRQIMVNLVSLSVFPFLGRNLMQSVLFSGERKAYDAFLDSRKTEVAEFIIRSIKPH